MAQRQPQTIVLGGAEYVVLPKAQYLRLLRAAPGTVDAVKHADTTLGANLRKARERAGMTQGALAEKLRVSQSMVSQAESGTSAVGESYVRRVLKACKLPVDWKP